MLLAGLGSVTLLLPVSERTESGRFVSPSLGELRSLRAQSPCTSRERERSIFGDILQGVLKAGERNIDRAGDSLLLVQCRIADVD